MGGAMSEPWECPRCGRMNAPFNPSCFCNKAVSSEHINDAVNYLKAFRKPLFSFEEIAKCIKRNQCLVCAGYHGEGVQCVYMRAE
jgi:hypothetical protein